MTSFFTAWCSYTSAVFWVVIPSINLSVRPSVTRVLCDKTKQCTADILIPLERAITLVFWHQQWLVGDAPCIWNLHLKWPHPFEKGWLRQISACNVSTVRDSQNVQLWRIGSRPWAFQRAIDGVHTLPLSPQKGGSKSYFLFFKNIISFSGIESAAKLFCVKTCSGSVVE